VSREAIMGRIRASLGVRDGDERRQVVADRLATAARNLVPARAALPHGQLVRQFTGYLEQQGATIITVSALADIAPAVARYLDGAELPPRVRCGTDPDLGAAGWASTPALRVLSGPPDESDRAGLSMAVAGVSETGTMVLASGPDNPVTLAFLPETHIVVVRESTIVGSYEDALAIVRARFGKGVMPRTLNLVSGPSRTADIGGKIVIGAHGPRRLGVLVVADQPHAGRRKRIAR
jgi:L-lactate dehydrogenase complex protein LldG